jgi:hypothetical protein
MWLSLVWCAALSSCFEFLQAYADILLNVLSKEDLLETLQLIVVQYIRPYETVFVYDDQSRRLKDIAHSAHKKIQKKFRYLARYSSFNKNLSNLISISCSIINTKI